MNESSQFASPGELLAVLLEEDGRYRPRWEWIVRAVAGESASASAVLDCLALAYLEEASAGRFAIGSSLEATLKSRIGSDAARVARVAAANDRRN